MYLVVYKKKKKNYAMKVNSDEVNILPNFCDGE